MLYILPQIPICPVPCLELIAAWAMTLPVVDVDDEAMSNHQTDGLFKPLGRFKLAHFIHDLYVPLIAFLYVLAALSFSGGCWLAFSKDINSCILSVTSCWVIVILLGGLMPNMPISPFTALTMKYSNSAFTSESWSADKSSRKCGQTVINSSA